MRSLLLVLVIAAGVAMPIAAFAHGGTEVNVKGDVRSNGPIEIVGEEFGTNDVVRIELRREGIDPVELGRVPADAEGGFDETLHVPANAPAGLYQLAADGTESATTEVTVLEPLGEQAGAPQPETASVENHRSAAETAGLASFVGALAIAAVGLLWLSRTRQRVARG